MVVPLTLHEQHTNSLQSSSGLANITPFNQAVTQPSAKCKRALLYSIRQPHRADLLRTVVLAKIEKLTFPATKEKTTPRQTPPQHRKKAIGKRCSPCTIFF
jgi:hypothetical protein